MKYWKNEEEPINVLVPLFEKLFKDDDLGAGLSKVNQLVLYDYTEDGPNCSFWMDTRDGKREVGPGKPADNPDLVMSLSADDAHRCWSNKLNPVIAITRKKIRVKGSATGLLKLAPKLKKIAGYYNSILEEKGFNEIIL